MFAAAFAPAVSPPTIDSPLRNLFAPSTVPDSTFIPVRAAQISTFSEEGLAV
jgi:hypothetical protein